MKKKINNYVEKLPVVSESQSEISKIKAQIAEKDKKISQLEKLVNKQGKSIDRLVQELAKKDKQVEELYKGIRDTKISMKEQFEKSKANEKVQLNALNRDLSKRIRYRYFQGLNEADYKNALKEWLYESIGEEADLDNPRTYNEKMQWIKLHSENEVYTRLADKYLVRDWVAEKVGEKYLVPLLGAWDRFEEIDFDKLPEKFVLKANHGCGYNYIVTDKSKFDYSDAKKKFSKWMKENFAWNTLELQYKNIKKKIIAEEYMENSDENLNDYKIFCFNGKPKYVMFLTERKKELKMAFFDLDWNLMPFTYSHPQYTEKLERPEKLDEMLEIAEKLSEGFPHVRVDLYLLNDGTIRFGEMTFTSASGGCEWRPAEYNRVLGDMIDLPL